MRSSSLRALARIVRAAEAADRFGAPSAEIIESLRAHDTALRSRRDFMKAAAVAGAAAAFWPGDLIAARTPSRDIAIVGAGLAGLACADALTQKGLAPSAIYEASGRAGGRCWSLRDFFPGQVAERGGEYVDNLHKTMLGYAKRFGLGVEDVSKLPGEVFYHFGGSLHDESEVVDEFREFVDVMRTELRRISGEVTADSHTPLDEQIDNVNLLDFLEGNNSLGISAPPLIKAVIIEAYEAEYGLAAAEQSCLNFLLFIHSDRRSKFTPFGIFSDERYHLLDGNDGIVSGLAGAVRPVDFGRTLVRIGKTAGGRIELEFAGGATVAHDAVVVTVPFTVLRNVQLDASLALPAEKTLAIQQLGYGTNAKMMIGFDGAPWRELGSNGAAYADLANVQATWETNPARAAGSHAILTDYSSAQRGASLNPAAVQAEAANFLAGLDQVFAGAAARASQQGGAYVVHLEHWPSSPFALGSYTCYKPGQFTSIAGNEGKPAGNLYFAGEHADSFYSWQGFMEGAALSGLAAASQIVRDLKSGAL